MYSVWASAMFLLVKIALNILLGLKGPFKYLVIINAYILAPPESVQYFLLVNSFNSLRPSDAYMRQ